MAIFKTILSCLTCAILASLLTVLFMREITIDHQSLVSTQLPRKSGENIPSNDHGSGPNKTLPMEILVILKDAAKEGAVCLDGSPPGYHWKKGQGTGINKWIIYFNGGAWCYDEQACYQRSLTKYGSTYYPLNIPPDQGMYSSNPIINPDFHNWNIISIIYCDGASFTGMRTKPVYFKDSAVYFRGRLILVSIIKDLLERGVHNAHEVILSGSSAGSLAVLFHADYIKSMLPTRTKLRALSDSGYFVDLKTHYGDYAIRTNFHSVIKTHNSTAGLHPACIKHTPLDEQWKCMFPQYFFRFIQTPVFILQSAYDVWQIMSNLQIVCKIPDYHILGLVTNVTYSSSTRGTSAFHASVPLSARKNARGADVRRQSLFKSNTFVKDVFGDSPGEWHWQGLYCSPAECTKYEIETILNIRKTTLEALKAVLKKSGSGLFLSSCLEHTQARYDMLWSEVKIRGKTMRRAINEWYTKKSGNHFYIGEHLSLKTCILQ